VYAGVRKVLGHIRDDMSAGGLQQFLIAGEIETQQSVAVLETLRPLRPAARGVAALDGEHGCAVSGIPDAVELERFA